MSDLYVLTVWKNGWTYAAPVYDSVEVPDDVVEYTRTLTRAEALRTVLDMPVNTERKSHGRQGKSSERPQFRA